MSILVPLTTQPQERQMSSFVAQHYAQTYGWYMWDMRSFTGCSNQTQAQCGPSRRASHLYRYGRTLRYLRRHGHEWVSERDDRQGLDESQFSSFESWHDCSQRIPKTQAP